MPHAEPFAIEPSASVTRAALGPVLLGEDQLVALEALRERPGDDPLHVRVEDDPVAEPRLLGIDRPPGTVDGESIRVLDDRAVAYRPDVEQRDVTAKAPTIFLAA